MTGGNRNCQLSSVTTIRKVLVVDDSAECRLLTTAYLRREGAFVFVEANSAKQAIEKLERETFDIVICDFFMGNETGLDVALYLQETEKPNAAFFIFTSSPNFLSQSVRETYRVFDKADILPLIEAIRALEVA